MRIIKRLLIILGAILLYGIIITVTGHNPAVINRSTINADEFIRSCVKGEYEKIARRPDVYNGVRMYAEGSAIQVMEDGNNVNVRLQENSGNVWYVVYTYPKGESRILEGDKITVYGLCLGTVTYTSIFGQQITIPGLEGLFIR